MPDDPTKKKPQDSSRVNVHENYEVEYWTKKFGVSPQQLKDAVKKVGPMVKDVQKELKK
jgi:hypothetical protein